MNSLMIIAVSLFLIEISLVVILVIFMYRELMRLRHINKPIEKHVHVACEECHCSNSRASQSLWCNFCRSRYPKTETLEDRKL
jgi:hypothetical protein